MYRNPNDIIKDCVRLFENSETDWDDAKEIVGEAIRETALYYGLQLGSVTNKLMQNKKVTLKIENNGVIVEIE